MATTVVNLTREQYDVYIGRGSPFGNPYTHVDSRLAKYRVKTREEAIAKYREWFASQIQDEAFEEQVLALRGKRLGCYCKPLACHGDIIVEWLEQFGEIERPRRTYVGHIINLPQDGVFVFGSNLDGFHGAGSAGFASFGVAGNHWREYGYDKKPRGWKGRWNVKGVAEGYQEGLQGASYAIPTVTRAGAKRSRTPEEIRESIREFYAFARANPEIDFFVAQENKIGLNGYYPMEMAEMFSCEAIPDNVIFEDGFSKLLRN